MTNRGLGTILAISILLPATAVAQTIPTGQATRREGFAIGVTWTNQYFVGKVVSIRLSAPAGNHAGFDVDLGYIVRGGRRSLGRRGFVSSTHLRWLPKARGESGVAAYLIFGVRLVRSTVVAHDGKSNGLFETSIDAPGLGIDGVYPGGQRLGAEFGNSITWGHRPDTSGKLIDDYAPYVSFFGQTKK